MRCTLERSDVVKALRAKMIADHDSLNPRFGEPAAVHMAAERIMVCADVLDWLAHGQSPAWIWSHIQGMETAVRDDLPRTVIAWAADGWVNEVGRSLRGLFTDTGWTEVKEFFE